MSKAGLTLPQSLGELAGVYDSLPFDWLLVGHCLLVSSWFTHLKDRFLLCYWVGLLAAFGGGILSALLLQDPGRASIAVFADNKVGLIWTICWWLVTYCPYGLVERLHKQLPVCMVTRACLNVLRAGVMASRIDLVVVKYPGVVAAPLIIGTIAASGGKFTIDGVLAVCGELKAPGEAVVPGFAFRSGFVGSIAYYTMVSVLEIFTRAEAKAIIISVFIAHGLAVDILKQPLDYTYPVARICHVLANVPMPGQQHAASKPKVTNGQRSSMKPQKEVKKEK